MFRILFTLPAILVSFFVFHLGFIADISGIFVLILTGLIIPLCAIASKQIIPEKSDYDFKYLYLVAIGTFTITIIFIVSSIVFYI